jgi:cytochrome c-type biogenesis protein CcmE
MKKLTIASTAALLALVSAVSLAHHSAAQFDLTIRDNKVTGIVKEFTVANPHTKIVLEITDAKGTRDVEFEGHSRNNYYRNGWRPALIKVGDTISIMSGPMRNGEDGGYALSVIAADGTQF